MARFSYPDFEAYRDGLRSFSGVIAFSIEQLALSHADGVVTQRRSDTGTHLTRLGLMPPAAVNKEIATTLSCRRTTSRCWAWRPSVAGPSTP